ncbi:MAG: GTPase HflX [Verrucomicrobiia bacterium]
MKALIETKNRKPERVFIIGVQLKSRDAFEVQDSMAELSELVKAAGGEVVGEGIQKLDTPHPATFIGKGKAIEFAQFCQRNEVDTVIFDDELTPAQARNLENIFNCKVIDRTSLILDIFALRAKTKEGKLQVELAQLKHLLPRLTRFWEHLSRQKGGIGMRGDGETQLETDRRRVQNRIARIVDQLEEVRLHRTIQRQGRQRHLWPLASLVGYTNAGKTTLLNALTGANGFAEDKLFATLDPMTRRLRLPTNQNVLLSDTVGFIRKLPHRLVEAFKATLEEVVQADLLLHVVDISHPQANEQILAVNSVLEEIGAVEKPILMVFNKIDRLMNGEIPPYWSEIFPNAIFVSAKTGKGIDELLDAIGSMLKPARTFVEILIPHNNPALSAKVYHVGQVVEKQYETGGVRFKVRLPPFVLPEFQDYLVKTDGI